MKNGAGKVTPRQSSSLVNAGDMPPCVGTPGSPCRHPVQAVLVAGYDDEMRCLSCNKIHIALVEREAGNATPLHHDSSKRQISDRINKKACELGLKKREQVDKLSEAMGMAGHVTRNRSEREPPATTEDSGARKASDEERRKAILKKYTDFGKKGGWA